MNIPVIRLEVQGMKHTMQVAVTEYLAKMDEDIQRAVETVCTPENVAQIIRTHAQAAIDDVLKREISNYFLYGQGREAVKAAVTAQLEGK